MEHMKQTIESFQDNRGIRIGTSNGYTVSIGFGGGHYCENYAAPLRDAKILPTSNMEVAIMNKAQDFVCLPHDVAGYVNVSQLGDIVAAVEANDWARVCFLCGVSEEDESKFPKKG